MYYTYMIRCKDNSIYTGITTDLERRFNEHFTKSKMCAKYTYVHEAIALEKAWQTELRKDACKLEYNIKRLSKPIKESLIKGTKELNEVFKNFDTDIYEVVKENPSI